MGRVAHQPETRNRRAIADREGAKGGNAHSQTAHIAELAAREVFKGAGGGSFAVDDRPRIELEIAPEFADRLFRVAGFQGFVLGAIAATIPGLRIDKGGRGDRRHASRGAPIALAADGHKQRIVFAHGAVPVVEELQVGRAVGGQGRAIDPQINHECARGFRQFLGARSIEIRGQAIEPGAIARPIHHLN